MVIYGNALTKCFKIRLLTRLGREKLLERTLCAALPEKSAVS